MGGPSKEEAYQFALMLKSGMPSNEAIRYFLPEDIDPQELILSHRVWVKSKLVEAASLAFQGKRWEDMSLDERIQLAIDKTYTEAAYFLYSHNYAQLMGADRQKADICRQTLEAKLAGTSGKMGPLETFWSDIKSGKVKLGGVGGVVPN